MRQKSVPTKEPAEEVIKGIRRATRRQFSAEEIDQNLYYRWSKEFLEAGKKRPKSSADVAWPGALETSSFRNHVAGNDHVILARSESSKSNSESPSWPGNE